MKANRQVRPENKVLLTPMLDVEAVTSTGYLDKNEIEMLQVKANVAIRKRVEALFRELNIPFPDQKNVKDQRDSWKAAALELARLHYAGFETAPPDRWL